MAEGQEAHEFFLATGAKLPGEVDWLHLHAHQIQHRNFFLTRDNAILKIAEELAQVGIVVMTPNDYLRLREAIDPGEDQK